MTQREKMTYGESLRVGWAFLWRGFIVTLFSVVSGALIGFILGFMFGMAHVNLLVIQVVCGIAAGLFSFFFWVPWFMRWALPRDFGPFRFDLVRVESASAIPGSPQH